MSRTEEPDQPCYDAILTFAAGALHIQSNEKAIIRIHFLPPDFPGASRPGHQMIVDDAPPVLIAACHQVRAYFSGQLQQFTTPIEIQAGSPFSAPSLGTGAPDPFWCYLVL